MRFIRTIFITLFAALLLLSLVSCSLFGGDNGNGTTTANNSGLPATTDTRNDNEFNDPEIKVETSPALEISEIMVRNSVNFADPNGDYSPWIEIHNISLSPIELSEYSLAYGGGSWQLPSGVINAGEYRAIFLMPSVCPLALESTGIVALFHGDYLTQRVPYFNTTSGNSFITASGTETALPTPGYTEARSADKLLVSEVMSKNTCYPIDGKCGGFVEIYNYGDSSIALKDFFITDSESFIYRMRLPDVTLASGAYYVLGADDLPFPVSESGGKVLITRNDGVLSGYMVYPEIAKNTSYISSMQASDLPTPGYENSEVGYMAYVSARSGLLINEVISSNTKYKKINDDYHDMIELVNTTGETIHLSDYYLSDSQKDLQKYQLPDRDLGPGELYVVIASGLGGEHAPFKLSQDGEKLFVSRSDGYITDALDVPYIPTNCSYGRYNGTLAYFATPSFDMMNPFGYTSLTGDPSASVASGFYTSALSVTLSGDGDIYYTTDGSAPTKSSKKYGGEVITVSKTTSIRVKCFNGDRIPSRDLTFNYFFNLPALTLPIVKVTVEHESMYGDNGIYTKYNSKREVEAHVALYVDGAEEFSVNCGLKVFGASSKQSAKKSYQLKFRAIYGCSKLKYDIFGDGEITEFNSLVLRSGSQDYMRAMMRDELVAGLVRDYMPEVLSQNYRPASLYINDEYVGVYYIREKINDDFVSAHTGVSPESVTIVNFVDMVVETGSDGTEWKNLWKWIQNNDLTKAENYEYICDHFCIESVIDFYIMLCWSDNRDCGNVRVYKSSEGDGKWRYISYDSDLGFGVYSNPSKSTATFLFGTYNAGYNQYNALIYKLFRNETFLDLFLTRLNELLTGGLYTDNVIARIDALEAAIDNDMSFSPQLSNSYLTAPSYTTWKNSWVQGLRKYLTTSGELSNRSLTISRVEAVKRDFINLLKLTSEQQAKYFTF